MGAVWCSCRGRGQDAQEGRSRVRSPAPTKLGTVGLSRRRLPRPSLTAAGKVTRSGERADWVAADGRGEVAHWRERGAWIGKAGISFAVHDVFASSVTGVIAHVVLRLPELRCAV